MHIARVNRKDENQYLISEHHEAATVCALDVDRTLVGMTGSFCLHPSQRKFAIEESYDGRDGKSAWVLTELPGRASIAEASLVHDEPGQMEYKMGHALGRKVYTFAAQGQELSITNQAAFVGRLAPKGGLSKATLIDMDEDPCDVETQIFALFLYLHYKEFRHRRGK
jgi:hypothetical protein